MAKTSAMHDLTEIIIFQQPQTNGPPKPKKAAAANGTQNKPPGQKPKKAAGLSDEQWEEWKKKDQEVRSGSLDIYSTC